MLLMLLLFKYKLFYNFLWIVVFIQVQEMQ